MTYRTLPDESKWHADTADELAGKAQSTQTDRAFDVLMARAQLHAQLATAHAIRERNEIERNKR